MKTTSTTSSPPAPINHQPSGSWRRRWWPALAPASVSVACAIVLAVQQSEIRDLTASLRTLSHDVTTTKADSVETGDRIPGIHAIATKAAVSDADEITRLQQRVAQLSAEISKLEQTATANAELRKRLATAPGLTPEELDAAAKAKEKALSVQCINNLKQFGLAVRIWAMDNSEVSPPDLLSMSNELSTPKILVCPADTNRLVAKSWTGFSQANCSYEYLTPSATNADAEPQRVLARCPIHGHIGLCDGSVQGAVGKNHPEWLKAQDGKLYLLER